MVLVCPHLPLARRFALTELQTAGLCLASTLGILLTQGLDICNDVRRRHGRCVRSLCFLTVWVVQQIFDVSDSSFLQNECVWPSDVFDPSSLFGLQTNEGAFADASVASSLALVSCRQEETHSDSLLRQWRRTDQQQVDEDTS